MKGETLFEKMTDISDTYIAEASLTSPVKAAGAKRKPFASLSHALSSGLGVACICFIVAIAAVVSMAAWGRMGTAADPAGKLSDTSETNPLPSDDYRFSFGCSNVLSSPPSPGDQVCLETWVINEGAPFTFEGSSMGFVPTAALVHTDTGYRIQGNYVTTKDIQRITVNTGDKGMVSQVFVIPVDAPTGIYDLELSCCGESEILPRVFTVAIRTHPDLTNLSFGYEPFDGFAIPGDRIEITTQVVNEGAPFTFEGSSMGFAPTAVLVHKDTGYRIQGDFAVTDDEVRFTINTGDTGRATQMFWIPADAPTGEYELHLSFADQEQVFENVLTVAIP